MRHKAPAFQILAQRFFAAGLLFCAAAVTYTAFHDGSGLLKIVSLLYGAGLAWFSIHEFQVATARSYGIEIEQRSIATIQRMAERYRLDAEANRRVPSLGDIDLILSRGGQSVVVEIKAFHSWSDREQRCRHAAEQAARGARFSGASRACVWLPAARPSWWASCLTTSTGEGAIVVLGGAHNMLRAANRLLPP